MAEITPCTYCGMPADSVDHFIPRTVRERITVVDDRLLPACRECNSALGASVYPNISERRKAAKVAIVNKYGHVLRAPKWRDDELTEMGDTLRSHLGTMQDLKRPKRRERKEPKWESSTEHRRGPGKSWSTWRT